MVQLRFAVIIMSTSTIEFATGKRGKENVIRLLQMDSATPLTRNEQPLLPQQLPDWTSNAVPSSVATAWRRWAAQPDKQLTDIPLTQPRTSLETLSIPPPIWCQKPVTTSTSGTPDTHSLLQYVNFWGYIRIGIAIGIGPWYVFNNLAFAMLSTFSLLFLHLCFEFWYELL